MTSPLFSNNEVSMLHALRGRATDCKANYKQKYIHTNILCSLCGLENEDQQHIFKCKVIQSNFITEDVSNLDIKYEDIFSQNLQKQKAITALFLNLFKIKDDIMKRKNSQEAPSNTHVMLDMSDYLLPCTVLSYFGK